MAGPYENEIKIVVRDYDELETIFTPFSWQDIEQGYLNPNNRIRKITEQNMTQYFFTYKQRLQNGHNLELEFLLDPDIGNEAWKHTKERLSKRRFSMVYQGCKWDIDFYRWQHGKYFVLAEIEMPTDQQQPENILPYLDGHIAYIVPRDDGRFTARLLANEDHAKAVYEQLKADGIDL